MSNPPVAFVAGATGYTGSQVVPALRARGVRVIAHVRPGSAAAAAWHTRFEALGAEVDETPYDEEAPVIPDDLPDADTLLALLAA